MSRLIATLKKRAWTGLRAAVHGSVCGKYAGPPPRLDGTRDSMRELRDLLVSRAIQGRYDASARRFRWGFAQTLQHSDWGEDADAYEFFARLFMGASFGSPSDGMPQAVRDTFTALLRDGADPGSPRHWGRIRAEQVLVENTSLIIGFLVSGGRGWDALTAETRGHLTGHFEACCSRRFAESNWRWFEVFHHLFLEKVTGVSRQQDVRRAWERLNSFYLGDGWYVDGNSRPGERRVDYYNAWAFHYYGLLFALYAPEGYGDIADQQRSRFSEFKAAYLELLGGGERPVPWGRSLIYRFGVLAPLGPAIKLGLLDETEQAAAKEASIRIISGFMASEGVLDRDGVLTQGFTAPNPRALENYSAPGSPYWALKAFSLLLLDPAHPFWKLRPEPLPARGTTMVASVPFCIRRESDGHVFLLNGGTYSKRYGLKYDRFAFSNRFPPVLGPGTVDHQFTRGGRAASITGHDPARGRRLSVEWEAGRAVRGRTLLWAVPGGYVSRTRFDCAEKVRLSYAGFTLPAAAGYAVERERGELRLRGAGLSTRLAVQADVPARLGPERVGGDRVLTPGAHVLPRVVLSLPRGTSRVWFWAAAGPDSEMQGGWKVSADGSVEIAGASYRFRIEKDEAEDV